MRTTLGTWLILAAVAWTGSKVADVADELARIRARLEERANDKPSSA